MALASAGQEAKWLRNLLLEILLASKNISKVLIHYDNQATMARAFSEVYNEKSRHIGLRYKYVKKEIISLIYVRSSLNLLDLFTKPLNRELVKINSRGIGIKLLE